MSYMNYSEIGRRIRTRRRQMRLTQSAVEQQVGMSPKYLSNIEHGRSIPSIDVVMQIADILHMTPDELLLGAVTDAEMPAPPEPEAALSARIQRLTQEKQVMARNFLDWLEEQK